MFKLWTIVKSVEKTPKYLLSKLILREVHQLSPSFPHHVRSPLAFELNVLGLRATTLLRVCGARNIAQASINRRRFSKASPRR